MYHWAQNPAVKQGIYCTILVLHPEVCHPLENVQSHLCEYPQNVW